MAKKKTAKRETIDTGAIGAMCDETRQEKSKKATTLAGRYRPIEKGSREARRKLGRATRAIASDSRALLRRLALPEVVGE